MVLNSIQSHQGWIHPDAFRLAFEAGLHHMALYKYKYSTCPVQVCVRLTLRVLLPHAYCPLSHRRMVAKSPGTVTGVPQILHCGVLKLKSTPTSIAVSGASVGEMSVVMVSEGKSLCVGASNLDGTAKEESRHELVGAIGLETGVVLSELGWGRYSGVDNDGGGNES